MDFPNTCPEATGPPLLSVRLGSACQPLLQLGNLVSEEANAMCEWLMLGGRAAIQRHPHSLEKRPQRSLTKLKKDTCSVPQPRRRNPS